MQLTGQNAPAVHPLERFLAVLGALSCLVITIVLWGSVSGQQPMWPLPGLYFIEVAGASLISAWIFARGGPWGSITLWAAVGMLGAFSILGIFSVGPLYFPIALIFAVSSITCDVRNKQPLAVHLGVCLLAGIVQAALMLAVIGLL